MTLVSRRALLGLSTPPKPRTVSIASNCLAAAQISCEVCADACDVAAIRFVRAGRVKRPYVEAGVCTGCDACVPVCPVGAIAPST